MFRQRPRGLGEVPAPTDTSRGAFSRVFPWCPPWSPAPPAAEPTAVTTSTPLAGEAQSHPGLALPGPRPRPGRPPGSPWPSPWPVTPGEPALPHAAPRGGRLAAPAGSASGARGFSQEAPSRPRRSSCWGCPAPDAGRAPPGPPDAGRAPAGPALSPRSLRLQHSLPRSTSPLEERKGTRHTVHTHRAVSPCARAAVLTPGSSPVPVAGIPVAAE